METGQNNDSKIPYFVTLIRGVTGVRAYGHVVAGHVAKGLWLPKRYAVSRD